MKKIGFLLILLNLFILSAKAEIAFIDINFILNKSQVGKFLNSHVEKIKQTEFQKYKEIESKLIIKEKSLIDQQNILDEKEFQDRLKNLTKEVQKYRSDRKKSMENLKKFRGDKAKEILEILNPIITKYVDANSILIVIPKKNIIVGKKSLDITNQIIELLNNDIKKLDF